MKNRRQELAGRRPRYLSAADAAVAVELAILSPLLVLVILGITDYGVLMGRASSLESASRAGVEVAKSRPGTTAANLSSLNLFPSGATPVVTSVCNCADGSWPAAAACPPGPFDTPCTGVINPFTGTTDQRPFAYVNVTGTQGFAPFSAWSGLLSSVTGQAFTRTQ